MPNPTAPPSYKSRNSTDQHIGLNGSHFYRQASLRGPGPLQHDNKDCYEPSKALLAVMVMLDRAAFFCSSMTVIYAGCVNEEYKKYRNRTLEGFRTWPDKLDTTEIKCLIALSIASFFQSIFTFLSLIGLESVSCTLVLLVMLSIFVTAYSAVVPYLYGINIFKTGAYPSNINLHSTLSDWTCEMEIQIGNDRIPFGSLCEHSVSCLRPSPISLLFTRFTDHRLSCRMQVEFVLQLSTLLFLYLGSLFYAR